MSQVIYDTLTLDQFLKLPEAKPPLEFIRGKVVQKVSPLLPHTRLEQTLWLWIYRHTIDRRSGDCFVALRCTFGGESYVPDLVYYEAGRIPSDPEGMFPPEGMHQAPDLVVEIISPGQTVKALSNRITRQVKNGVRLGWLIQSSRRRVFVFRAGTSAEMIELGGTLDGHDVLPGFRLPLNEMFNWLVVGTKPFPG
jgi:Uma2 family endonuclease